jgi:hypothetical protein
VDYVGNYKKHAKTSSGSDNLVCTVTSATTAVCDGVIAIGGSLLLANHVAVNIAVNNPTVAINGGTEQFKNAHGTVKSVPISTSSNNSDLTVTYST